MKTKVVLLALIALLVGCATDVKVKGGVPAPLSEQLPFHVQLVLDDAFRSYQYVDDPERGKKVTFAVGEAQTDMFRVIAAGMFRQVTETAVQAPGVGDLILYPRVEEIQLATPFENKLKVFEVWIRYNLRVFDGSGAPLADWIMTSYGKTPTRFLSSDEDALNQAATVALRDAGARLTLELTRVPEIRQWLAENNR